MNSLFARLCKSEKLFDENRDMARRGAISKSNASSKDRILESVVHHCYENGGLYVGLRDIAETAGVAFGTVRYHFAQEGKDLVREAIYYVVLKGRQYIDLRLDAARSKKRFHPVHEYVDAMFGWIVEHPTYASFLVHYYYLSASKNTVEPLATAFLEGGRRRLEGLFTEAIGRGLYPPAKDLQFLSASAHSQLLGNWLKATMDPGSMSRGKQNTKEVLDLLAIAGRHNNPAKDR
jgi:AcrR family transcriptional regulator